MAISSCVPWLRCWIVGFLNSVHGLVQLDVHLLSWGSNGSSGGSVLSWLGGLNHSGLALWAVSAVLAWALLSALLHLLRDGA